ncbi:hypothetical protein BVRB_5g112930 [Beta vulgaris subsp. vulgaris]|nr:hypothetical protein BVRB_5g112930 [Beta vulgaris subsp. vulgaris]
MTEDFANFIIDVTNKIIFANTLVLLSAHYSLLRCPSSLPRIQLS